MFAASNTTKASVSATVEMPRASRATFRKGSATAVQNAAALAGGPTNEARSVSARRNRRPTRRSRREAECSVCRSGGLVIESTVTTSPGAHITGRVFPWFYDVLRDSTRLRNAPRSTEKFYSCLSIRDGPSVGRRRGAEAAAAAALERAVRDDRTRGDTSRCGASRARQRTDEPTRAQALAVITGSRRERSAGQRRGRRCRRGTRL